MRKAQHGVGGGLGFGLASKGYQVRVIRLGLGLASKGYQVRVIRLGLGYGGEGS